MSRFSRILSLVMTVIMLLGCISIAVPVSAADTATISFDLNGGYNPPADVTVNCGTVIYLTDHQPTKPGMVFRGWAFNKEDADRGAITYAVGVSNPILVNSSATLYASWAYEVNLHPGHQGWGNTYKLYKFPDVDLDLFHHKSDIQANYGMLPGTAGDVGNLMVFVEWNTNMLSIGRGNGTSYHEKYTANASTTLYCVWGNPVVYDADGGTFPVSGTDLQEEFVVNYSNLQHETTSFANFYIPDGENAPYKAGARQLTDEDGNELYGRVFADSGNIVRFESRNTWLEIPIFNDYSYQWADFECAVTSYGETGMKFTAVWEPAVVYKANGTGNDVVEYMTWAGPTLYDYADYTVLDNNTAGFKGWNTKPDGTGTAYAAGDVIDDYATSNALVLYAQWDNTPEAKEYTVAFNAMEGYLDASEQSFTIAYGEKFTDAIDAMPVPTRPGYTFRGWYNEVTGAELVFDEEYYSYTANTSYVPAWELHSDHILSAFKKTSDCENTGYFTQFCEACDWNSNIEYEKTGHNFSGWKQTGNGSEVQRACVSCNVTEVEASTAMVKQEVIAYCNRSVPLNDSDMKYIDTLNYFFAPIDNGAGNYPFAGSYFAESTNMRNRARAQNPNIKIVLTIMNMNIKAFESWLTPGNRQEFANHLVGVVKANGFDGLDIDFEFPSDMTLKDDYAALLAEIRSRFNALESSTGKHYILSMTTPAAHWATEKFDLVACSQSLDYFNIMNYDLYCGTAIPYTHHHTPPYDNRDPYGHVPTGGSVQGDITLYKSLGIPADKIVSGMGLYARHWSGAANINHGLFQSAALDESNIHYDLLISQYLNKNGYTRYWDDTSKAPYLYNPSGGSFYSYDDPESLSYKLEIIAREGVRGCMVFDYVTCDGAGIFPHIRNNIGTVAHGCYPGRYEITQLSCDTAGHAIAYCGICGKMMNDQMIYNEGHYATDWDMHTEPTAATAGKLSASCLFCGETIYREIDALGYKVTFDAGEGSKIGSTSYIIQKGQTYAEVVGEDPQATLEGTTLVGWYCGDYALNTADTFNFDSDVTFVAVWEDEGEHTHAYTSKVTKAATCTADGVMTYTCRCGDSYTEVIPATGHNYTSEITKEATCGEDGIKTYTCQNCGDSYTEAIPGGEHTYDAGSTTTLPTCTEDGVKTYTCTVCGATKTEAIAAMGHAWKDWEVVKEATETENGLKQRSCRRGCGAVEEEVIPALGTVTTDPTVAGVNNYTVTLNNINNIKEIRYAIGHYTTGAEVRAAEKNQTLSASLVNSYTVDGVMTYEVPWVGEYTFWVRLNDGSQYFIYADVTEINPYLESDGLRLTVKDFGENYKDMWIAEGTYNSYAEIKNNATVKYQAAATKLANYFATHDFSYTTANPGAHTVLIRYNDGSVDVMHIDLTVDVPTFDVNGLQVTVGNIPGVKIIRTAYGEYNSVAEMKKASGVRNFNNKTAIKDAQSYKIQYRDNGVVTLIVEYNTGYKHIEHVTIAQKVPTFTQDGNKVTIGNLDGLVIVRYAPGKYTNSNAIKNAEGSQYAKADSIVDGQIVITDLTSGRWSFCVQYDDESYNYYVITVE